MKDLNDVVSTEAKEKSRDVSMVVAGLYHEMGEVIRESTCGKGVVEVLSLKDVTEGDDLNNDVLHLKQKKTHMIIVSPGQSL